MEIIIPSVPIAKKRPRFFRRGNFVGTYNDQVTEEGRWILEAKGQILARIEGPVRMEVDFVMPIPSTFRKGDRRRIDDGERMPHIKKPDLDNLIKFVKDCLNGLAWKDDSQVCKVSAQKFYGREPQTRILLEPAIKEG